MGDLSVGVNSNNSINSIIKKEVNFSEYLESDSFNNIIEQNEELDFQGISNGFLSEIVYAITEAKFEIIGEVEALFPCPCCGYKTLTELYNLTEGTGYDICSYCKWQDDGTADINRRISVNRGTMTDYRNKINENPNRSHINKWFV